MSLKDQRKLLQAELEGYFDGDSRVTNPENHVSFQPNEGATIPHPHIVYKRDPAYLKHADNIKYLRVEKYEVTLIDRDPDSPIYEKLVARSFCKQTTSFVTDGLNHSVFDLYH